MHTSPVGPHGEVSTLRNANGGCREASWTRSRMAEGQSGSKRRAAQEGKQLRKASAKCKLVLGQEKAERQAPKRALVHNRGKW